MGHAVPAMLLALLLFNVGTYLTEAAVLCVFLLIVSNQSYVFSFTFESFPSDNRNTFSKNLTFRVNQRVESKSGLSRTKTHEKKHMNLSPVFTFFFAELF